MWETRCPDCGFILQADRIDSDTLGYHCEMCGYSNMVEVSDYG